jgi:hypothetical protein
MIPAADGTNFPESISVINISIESSQFKAIIVHPALIICNAQGDDDDDSSYTVLVITPYVF